MYVETDFLLALIKDEDWLSENAEKIYRENKDELWTSRYTFVELMLVAYREDKDVMRTVANTAKLVEVKDEIDDIRAAASYVSEEDLTPFDALHLVKSDGAKIVSSDGDYDRFADRIKLEDA